VAAKPPIARSIGFPAVIRRDARLLILGSFPGQASLAAGQYYAHPRNLFWPIVGELVGKSLVDAPYRQRLKIVRDARIAIWDVVESCMRPGSLDSAIRDADANRFARLLARAPALGAVAFNGKTASQHAPWFEAKGFRVYRLPSTSPAYASMNSQAKHRSWSVLSSDGWITRQ
jgi:double-stranded uracil-DNA glycosylase